eukprot:8600646-Ditylum_brightwellii.AAC.1
MSLSNIHSTFCSTAVKMPTLAMMEIMFLERQRRQGIGHPQKSDKTTAQTENISTSNNKSVGRINAGKEQETNKTTVS